MTRDADIARQLCLEKSIQKPLEDYEVIGYLGSNIVNTNNEVWRKHKVNCAQGFSDQNIKAVTEISVSKMRELFTVWEKRGYIDADQDCLDYSLSVFSEGAFGKKLYLDGRPQEVDSRFKQTFAECLITTSISGIWRMALPSFLFRLPIATVQKVALSFDELTGYIKNIISNGNVDEGRKDILSALLRAKNKHIDEQTQFKGLTDQEILADIYVFLIAGHETSAHTLSFALRYLALYPEYQEELYQDTLQVLGPDGIPSYEVLSKLSYTSKVLKEALRLFPAIPRVPKRLAHERTLKSWNGQEYKMPAGTDVHLDIRNLHRNPEYWSSPNCFNPHRWDPDSKDVGTKTAHCFIPFSYGPRACIGRRFAEVMSQVFLSMIVLKFKWELVDPQKHTEKFLVDAVNHLTLQPVNHVRFKVTPRV